MSTHNICFRGKIRKFYWDIPLIWSYEVCFSHCSSNILPISQRKPMFQNHQDDSVKDNLTCVWEVIEILKFFISSATWLNSFKINVQLSIFLLLLHEKHIFRALLNHLAQKILSSIKILLFGRKIWKILISISILAWKVIVLYLAPCLKL